MADERNVSERLERIAALRRAKAAEGALLAELRGLLGEGEARLAGEDGSRQRGREPAGGVGGDPGEGVEPGA